MVGLTSWQALKERANLKPGQKVFISRRLGWNWHVCNPARKISWARVANTTRHGKLSIWCDFGADEVVDYKKQEFEDVLRDYDAGLAPSGAMCQKALSNSQAKELYRFAHRTAGCRVRARSRGMNF